MVSLAPIDASPLLSAEEIILNQTEDQTSNFQKNNAKLNEQANSDSMEKALLSRKVVFLIFELYLNYI
jgi:hypothetical protein